jgi:hypothetical protein
MVNSKDKDNNVALAILRRYIDRSLIETVVDGNDLFEGPTSALVHIQNLARFECKLKAAHDCISVFLGNYHGTGIINDKDDDKYLEDIPDSLSLDELEGVYEYITNHELFEGALAWDKKISDKFKEDLKRSE